MDQNFTLFKEAIQLLFQIQRPSDIAIFSAEKIKLPIFHRALSDQLELKKRVFVFSATKLGGEVDLPEAPDSPGTKVDVSIIEVTACDATGRPSAFGQNLFFEIQTADFHGSPLHAINELEKVHAARADKFHHHLSLDVEISGQGVEGPNKSNIFKRTFYQMALKVSIASDPNCAGFVLAIPASVWGSWRKHLGNPVLHSAPKPSNDKLILATGETVDDQLEKGRSWIFVFDIDSQAKAGPRSLVIVDRVSASTAALLEHAFTRVAKNIVINKVVDKYRSTLAKRIQDAWSVSPKQPKQPQVP